MMRLRQINQVRLVTALSFLTALYSGFTRADSEPPSTMLQTQPAQASPSSSTLLKKETFRIRNFTEFMTPAANNNENSVPDMQGGKLMPTNAFNIFWVDYEIAKDTKIVYYQRANLNFATNSMTTAAGPQTLTPPDAVARNPRFALRRVNVFKVPHLQTTYDLYYQPGLAPEGRADIKGRSHEFGIRTNTSYTFSASRWNMGLVTETTISAANEMNAVAAKNANFYGWAMPWITYDLSPHVATQHYMTVNFQHVRNIEQFIQWDDPMPYTQNGIGFDINNHIWAAAFINNYLGTAPTLSNTWASLWLTLKVL